MVHSVIYWNMVRDGVVCDGVVYSAMWLNILWDGMVYSLGNSE